MTSSGARLPWQLSGMPRPPLRARQCLRLTISARLSVPATARTTTSPPSPPSPPSGPPRGTYFSRRKWIEPSPPRPAITVSRARSWNIWRSVKWRHGGRGRSHDRRQRARGRARLSAAPHREHRVLPPPHQLRGRRRRRSRLARVAARDRRPSCGRRACSRAPCGYLGLLDRDEAALSARPECDLAVSHREDRVVLADPGARAGTEARAALADEDHPRRHVLAGEELHAEHLQVRVAPVPPPREPLP